MEPQALAKYDPQIAALHERTLKRGSFSTKRALTDAIDYFETISDHPKKDDAKLTRCLLLARTQFIPHLEREESFNTLLALEQTSPDITRWPEIVKLLDSVGCFLSVPTDITGQLMDLCASKQKKYETWRIIIKPLFPCAQPGVTPSMSEIEAAPVLPSLPPLSEVSMHDSSEEDQSDQDDDIEEDDSEESDQDEVRQDDSADSPQTKQPAVQKKAPAPKKKHVFVSKKKKNKKKGKQGKGKKKKSKLAQLKRSLTKCFWDALHERNSGALNRVLTIHKGVLDANMHHATLGKPALHLAVMLEDPASCAVLLEHGAKPCETSSLDVPLFFTHPLRVSALALAVHARSTEIVELLLKKGADPNQPVMCKDEETEHILCLAASQVSFDQKYTPQSQEHIVRRLLLAGAKAPCKNIVLFDPERNKRWTIDLEKKAYQNCMQAMLECTKQIKCFDETIMLLANSQAITSVLEAQENDVEEPTPTVINLLWHAVNEQDENQIHNLLKAVQDPTLLTSASDCCHLGMLHYCVTTRKRNLCTLLLDGGADPNGIVEITMESEETESEEILQVTPLTFAILNGDVDLATLLIDRGADPNKLLIHKPDGDQEYPLCCAIAGLHSENPEVSLSSRKQMIKHLLKRGATECNKNIVLLNTKTNSVSLLDPSNAEEHEIICMLLEEENFEECMEFNERALILKASFDVSKMDKADLYISNNSTDQEISE